MFEFLKGQTKSWSTKIIIILLALSFAVWGISDVFRPGNSDTVASVGETEIAAATLGREFNAEMRQIQSRYPNFTGDQAREIGLPAQILRRLVEQALIVEEARSSGMVISDVMIANQIIKENPALIENGKFNNLLYERALQRSGKSIESFENGVKNEILTKQVIDSIYPNRKIPEILADFVEKYNQERRDVQLIKISSDLDNRDLISDNDIESYYKENSEKYRNPEYRSISILRLNSEAVKDEIELTEEDIFAEYEYRSTEFELPERRDVTQILSSDEVLINNLKTAIDNGQSFIEIKNIASEQGAVVTELPDLTNGSLPKEADIRVFNTGRGEITAPIETPFGWHLFLINEVKEAGLIPYQDIKDEIYDQMFAEIATDTLYGLSANVEDILAGGGSLEDAANSINLQITKVGPFDSYGVDKVGDFKSAIFNGSEKILNAAFSVALGETSDLYEIGEDGYFLLRVDNIEESSIQPLSEILNKVKEDINTNLINEKSLLIAEDLSKKIKSGVLLNEIIKSNNFLVRTINGLSRSEFDQENGITAELNQKLFAVKANARDPLIAKINSDYHVLIPLNKYFASPENFESTRNATVYSIQQSRKLDTIILYRFALQAQHNIEVNGSTFERLFAKP